MIEPVQARLGQAMLFRYFLLLGLAIAVALAGCDDPRPTYPIMVNGGGGAGGAVNTAGVGG